jgi:hypothetical protein
LRRTARRGAARLARREGSPPIRRGSDTWLAGLFGPSGGLPLHGVSSAPFSASALRAALAPMSQFRAAH